MSAFPSLLHYSRRSNRLIQLVMLAFVLSLGVAIATPAVQAQNLSPDQQMICVGSGGMKVVTFAADGSAQEVESAHGLECLSCGALQATMPRDQYQQGFQTAASAKSIPLGLTEQACFELRAPPARGPPAI